MSCDVNLSSLETEGVDLLSMDRRLSMAPGKARINSRIDQTAPLPSLSHSLLTTKAAFLFTRRPVIIFCFLKRAGSHLPQLWCFLCNEALRPVLELMAHSSHGWEVAGKHGAPQKRLLL